MENNKVILIFLYFFDAADFCISRNIIIHTITMMLTHNAIMDPNPDEPSLHRAIISTTINLVWKKDIAKISATNKTNIRNIIILLIILNPRPFIQKLIVSNKCTINKINISHTAYDNTFSRGLEFICQQNITTHLNINAIIKSIINVLPYNGASFKFFLSQLYIQLHNLLIFFFDIITLWCK